MRACGWVDLPGEGEGLAAQRTTWLAHVQFSHESIGGGEHEGVELDVTSCHTDHAVTVNLVGF